MPELTIEFAVHKPPSYSRNGKRVQLEGPPKPWDYWKATLGEHYAWRKCPLKAAHEVLECAVGVRQLARHFHVDAGEDSEWADYKRWRDTGIWEERAEQVKFSESLFEAA